MSKLANIPKVVSEGELKITDNCLSETQTINNKWNYSKNGISNAMGKHKQETRAKWRAENREHNLAYAREYNRRYYLAHRENLMEKHREWSKQHACTEEYKAKHRERKRRYEREYYQKHKEVILAKCKAYYHTHIEERRAKNNEYYHTHRDRLVAYQKARRCGVTIQDILPTPAEESQTPIVVVAIEPAVQQTEPQQQAELPQTHNINTLIGKLQHDTQQLYNDVAARVAEMERLFDGWE